MAVRIASQLQAHEIRRGYLRLIYNIVAVHLEAFALEGVANYEARRGPRT